jgi:metal-responsive CopG/Arc/MetJ family transcriptional regulator
MKTIAVTVDEHTLERLDRLTSERGKDRSGPKGGRSEIVRTALHEFLARRDKEEREDAEWKIWSRNLGRINRQAAALLAEQAEP